MRDGDRLAGLVWRRYVDRVARGLSLVVNVLDPDVLVLGGGMSNVDESCTPTCRAARGATRSRRSSARRVVRAAHGDSSGVRGAARLCWRTDDG